MQTRSTPSVASLHSLAREAGLSDYSNTPKPILHRILKDQYNMERLQRAYKRGLKRRIGDGDVSSFDHDDDHRSSASSSSSSSPRALRLAGRSTRQEDELDDLSDIDEPRGRKRHRKGGASGKGKGKGKGRLSPPPRGSMFGHTRSKTKAVLMDPIMLTELPPDAKTFEFKRPNGTAVVYHLDSLIDYFLATGDFTEPETRLEFSEVDLKQIDQLAQTHNLGKDSVLAAKLDPSRFDEAHFRRDAVAGLERCAGELVADMLKVIEGDDPEEGQMRLVMYLFPLFSDLHRQLHTADADYCRRCMDHFVAYVKGPPNRPTVDHNGFLPIILGFFHQVNEGQNDTFGF